MFFLCAFFFFFFFFGGMGGGGVKDEYNESKINIRINNFKNVNLPFLQGIRFNIFSLTLTITEVI